MIASLRTRPLHFTVHHGCVSLFEKKLVVAMFLLMLGCQVYNLCSERTYDHAKFHNRVLHFPLYVIHVGLCVSKP
jgi:hypothetical protein